MTAADVLIVGGGVIGASIAYHLAERGMRVTVLERGRNGGHASLASAGLLHPIMDPEVTPALRDLTAASNTLFPALVARLRDLTGIDPQYQTNGWLRVALEPHQVAALEAQATERARQDYGLRMLSGDEVRALEPALSPAVVAGLHLPRGAQVYVPALLAAYLHAAAHLGGTVRLGVEAHALCLDGRRVVGART